MGVDVEFVDTTDVVWKDTADVRWYPFGLAALEISVSECSELEDVMGG